MSLVEIAIAFGQKQPIDLRNYRAAKSIQRNAAPIGLTIVEPLNRGD